MTSRKNQVLFRLNDKEFNRLMRDVKRTGLSREAYLRKLVMGAEIKELPNINYVSIIYELSKIGTNMHQIAIKAHKYGFIDTPMYDTAYEQVQETLGKIMQSLY